MSLSALLVSTTGPVKVVVSLSNSVDTPVLVTDPETLSRDTVPCTSTADCGPYGGTCKALGALGYSACATTRDVNTVMYVKNQTGANRADPAVIPCDGRTYAVEVYGSDSASAPFALTDLWASAPFVMPAGCGPVTPTWNAQPDPTWAFPTIYAGLPAPYDRYTVQLQVSHPFSTAGWSISQGPIAPISYSGTSATFASPAVAPPAGTLAFAATLRLDPTLLLSGEAADSWVRLVSSATTVVPSSSIPLP